MSQSFIPRTPSEVVEAVRWSVAGGGALRLSGLGTKEDWGRPVDGAGTLSLRAFGGIDLYEPEELVLSVRAGTPMSEVEQRLAQHGQHLAFEPPDFGPLFGHPAGGGSLGGAIGCNLAGPRRVSAGAARDHVLGFSGVNGLGEPFKAGGRVVKNVTGFDLSKLLTGSFGTLAVMTEITLKVLPAPEDVRTVLVFRLAPTAAIEALGIALRSPHEVSGAAYLPHSCAARSSVSTLAHAAAPVAVVRIEGAAPSVAARCEALRSLLSDWGEIVELGEQDSRRLWREIRDVHPLIAAGHRSVWRLSVPPAAGAGVAARVCDADDDIYFDWGGGLIWLASAGDPIATEPSIRAAVAQAGGHATLIRAAAAVRSRVAVFQPLSRIEAGLVRRIKDQFDPHRILNPGRMYEGV